MSQPPVVRLNGPVDAITYVSHMIGYHPEDSIVVLGVDCHTIARIDHPHAPHEMLMTIVTLLSTQYLPGRKLIICFTDNLDDAYAAAELLRVDLPGPHFEPIRVHQGRYWTLDRDMFEGPGTPYVFSDFSAYGLDPLDIALDRDHLHT